MIIIKDGVLWLSRILFFSCTICYNLCGKLFVLMTKNIRKNILMKLSYFCALWKTLEISA